MRFVPRLYCVPVIAILWGSSAWAGVEAGGQKAYLVPPPAVMEAVLAARKEPFERVLPDPTGTRYLVVRDAGLPPLALLDRPIATWVHLKVDIKARRSLWEPLQAVESLAIHDFEGRRVLLKAPEGVRIGQARWSPDGRWISFLAHADDGTRLFVADPATGASRPVCPSPLLLVRHVRYDWTADGRSLVALLSTDAGRNPPSKSPHPIVRRSRPANPRPSPAGTTSPMPSDVGLFSLLNTGQLTVIDVAGGTERRVGKPAMISSVRPSPDASFFRVTIQTESEASKPGIGIEEVIWDGEGKSVSRLRTLEADAEGRLGGRDEPWNPLLLAEWMPGGRAMSYVTPWGVTHWEPDENRSEVVWRSTDEIREVSYSGDGRILFARVSNGEGETIIAVHLENPNKVHALTRQGPGDLRNKSPRLLNRNPTGNLAVTVVSSDRRHAYLVGPREAPRAFLDRVEIATGKRERIWQGANDTFDELVAILDDDADRILIQSESPTDPPDSFLRHRSGATTRLTSNVDPSPRMSICHREDLTVTRADGFRFRVRVTLPRQHADGAPAPALFWLYPVPYPDQAAYDASRPDAARRHAFPTYNATSPRIITQAGYAAVELDCPIVGPPGKAYDGYVKNLTQNLDATVDELACRGLVDRNRLAIGGHSGGATAAACALAYTDHFKAGLAWSGSYDMLLNPTGMGSGHERRPLWEARDNYLAMSALLHADRIRGALFLSHGADDTNPLTRTVNAEALYRGLEALGRSTTFCLYPLEDHDFVSRETILDQWSRWIRWLDEQVR
ncbi:prolyl oligopeptidase family serine peptidase [Singulisphaera sp. Ch08]|uniref:Prolyl oligopeptidase family serine peptidase n=1 Tax=Singulisphaera sp. Ch08 TaxID=3120278 RepID=A0AAU7CLN0_9BACT